MANLLLFRISELFMPLLATLSLIGLLVVLIAAVTMLVIWRKYRGDRVVTCPENHRPVGVQVDAGRAALAAFGRHPELRLSECSRWPERAGCGQQCLQEIENSSDGCLVRNILAAWYQGKSCTNCGLPIGELQWTGAKPGLLLADKTSVEWGQVPVERLHETLSAASPVCFACHMANTLVRDYPSIALERSRPGFH
jgi:hypothetical protein